MFTKLTLIIALATAAVPAIGQVSVGTVGSTTHNATPSNQVSVGRVGTTTRNPAYNSFYSPSRYALSPYMLYQRQNFVPRRVVGNVQPYSEVDYGRLVLSTLQPADPTLDVERTDASGSILDQTTQTATGTPAVVQTEVTDVIDRGIIILPTREELRLRGVVIPSETSTNDIDRLYAREAINLLNQLVSTQQVTLSFGDPVRDLDGRILAYVYLPDGTELNRMMLERGYGRVRPEDFQLHQDYSALTAAQQKARDNRLGLWSKNQ